jgi:hypothetical protein
VWDAPTAQSFSEMNFLSDEKGRWRWSGNKASDRTQKEKSALMWRFPVNKPFVGCGQGAKRVGKGAEGANVHPSGWRPLREVDRTPVAGVLVDALLGSAQSRGRLTPKRKSSLPARFLGKQAKSGVRREVRRGHKGSEQTPATSRTAPATSAFRRPEPPFRQSLSFLVQAPQRRWAAQPRPALRPAHAQWFVTAISPAMPAA